MAVFNPENIPRELKVLSNWALWRKEENGGKIQKVPYQISSGKKAKSNDPSTWGKFDTAITAYQDVEGFDGLVL
jgi:putative DNA primase/helicase